MSIRFFPMDPSAVSLQPGPQTKAHATISTKMAHVIETPVISSMSVTGVMGLTPGMTVSPAPSRHRSGKGCGTKIAPRPTQRLAPQLESEDGFGSLPTPINVQRLEDTLADHPDHEFVLKLCDILRNGADVGFTGRRIARFSRNLPTALSNNNNNNNNNKIFIYPDKKTDQPIKGLAGINR